MQDAYQVKLDLFEGPLDLLLHLIKKHEVDVYSIPIASITDQYLAYIKAVQDLNLDVAGEYLVMAATLIYLKSRMLLPVDEQDEELEEDEGLDPQAELVRQLVEYQRYKAVAEALAERPVLGRDVFPRPVAEPPEGGVDVEPMRPLRVADLIQALERVLARRAKQIVHQVEEDSLTLRDGLEMVLTFLRLTKRSRFDGLFPERSSRIRIIVIFLAILELIRLNAIAVAQSETYGEIDIELRHEIEPQAVLDLFDGGPGTPGGGEV